MWQPKKAPCILFEQKISVTLFSTNILWRKFQKHIFLLKISKVSIMSCNVSKGHLLTPLELRERSLWRYLSKNSLFFTLFSRIQAYGASAWRIHCYNGKDLRRWSFLWDTSMIKTSKASFSGKYLFLQPKKF